MGRVLLTAGLLDAFAKKVHNAYVKKYGPV